MTALANPRASLHRSVQGVKWPTYKEYRRVSIGVKALLQCGPGAPEPSDEAIERLFSLGPDLGMESE